MTRYPFDPINALVHQPPAWAYPDGVPRTTVLLAARLGVTRRTVIRWRKYGLSQLQADRAATAMGFHPCELWPDWGSHPVPSTWRPPLEPRDCRVCGSTFAPTRPGHRYCGTACRWRARRRSSVQTMERKAA